MSKVIKLDSSGSKRASKQSSGEPNPVQLLPSDEHRLIDAYFDGEPDQSTKVARACDRLSVPADVYISRVAAAAGQILIQAIQDELPQWALANASGEIVVARKLRGCSKRARLALAPVHLFTINWADSGPGFSWPEKYSLVYVPWRERYVVIASQDSTDVWGCTDQAIGHFARATERVAGIESVIRDYWLDSAAGSESGWAYLFDTGLIDAATAESWRELVWPKPEPEEE